MERENYPDVLSVELSKIVDKYTTYVKLVSLLIILYIYICIYIYIYIYISISRPRGDRKLGGCRFWVAWAASSV